MMMMHLSTKAKPLNTNATVWFNKTCTFHQCTLKYINIDLNSDDLQLVTKLEVISPAYVHRTEEVGQEY